MWQVSSIVRAARGFSLPELVVAIGISACLASIAVPALLFGRDAMRGQAAARYVASRMLQARFEAARRDTAAAFRVTVEPDGTRRLALYADGDGDGVRTADIGTGEDPLISEPETLVQQFPGVMFAIASDTVPVDAGDSLADGDPVRLGRAGMVSFSPSGGASGGSVYLLDRAGRQFAVRVLGSTGRVRVMRYDPRTATWSAQ